MSGNDKKAHILMPVFCIDLSNFVNSGCVMNKTKDSDM